MSNIVGFLILMPYCKLFGTEKNDWGTIQVGK